LSKALDRSIVHKFTVLQCLCSHITSTNLLPSIPCAVGASLPWAHIAVDLSLRQKSQISSFCLKLCTFISKCI